ncbi:MAG: hypothetical protein A2289_14680 [Deltaproteobacteria bacterium RIFOXYA12_FULL_58_15]|nr:MAG: hypothetical protein A2289_14680 [Deltaproteobacteria bacterium RIFOXYA12_FULL_58_15]OGR07853.1 MAG: hypothetical protein A2341_07265 [Deltaproteobacteria bacterium RIFOXYB12_FULL_58_9]
MKIPLLLALLLASTPASAATKITKSDFQRLSARSLNIVNYFQSVHTFDAHGIFDLDYRVSTGFLVPTTTGEIAVDSFNAKLLGYFPVFYGDSWGVNVFFGAEVVGMGEAGEFRPWVLGGDDDDIDFRVNTGQNILGADFSVLNRRLHYTLATIGTVAYGLGAGDDFEPTLKTPGISVIPGTGESADAEIRRSWHTITYDQYRFTFLTDEGLLSAPDYLSIGLDQVTPVVAGLTGYEMPFRLSTSFNFYSAGANVFNTDSSSFAHAIYATRILEHLATFVEYSIVPFQLNEARLEANINIGFGDEGVTITGATLDTSGERLRGEKLQMLNVGGSLRASAYRTVVGEVLFGGLGQAFANLAILDDGNSRFHDFFFVMEYGRQYSETARQLFGFAGENTYRLKILYRYTIPQG